MQATDRASVVRSKRVCVQGRERGAAVPSLAPGAAPLAEQKAQPHVQVILPSRLVALLDVTAFVICKQPPINTFVEKNNKKNTQHSISNTSLFTKLGVQVKFL